MNNDALIQHRLRLLAAFTSPAPTRDTPSQALDDVISAQQQRKAQERAKDAEINADLRQIAERYRREQIDRDADARYEALTDEGRAHLTESVREFGSDVVTALWRRTYDATFILPTHLRGIAGDAHTDEESK